MGMRGTWLFLHPASTVLRLWWHRLVNSPEGGQFPLFLPCLARLCECYKYPALTQLLPTRHPQSGRVQRPSTRATAYRLTLGDTSLLYFWLSPIHGLLSPSLEQVVREPSPDSPDITTFFTMAAPQRPAAPLRSISASSFAETFRAARRKVDRDFEDLDEQISPDSEASLSPELTASGGATPKSLASPISGPVTPVPDQDVADDFAFAFDIDGVLVRGGRPIPEAIEAMKVLNGENEYNVRV